MTMFKPVKKNIDGRCWPGVMSSIRTSVNLDSVNLVWDIVMQHISRSVDGEVYDRIYSSLVRNVLPDSIVI